MFVWVVVVKKQTKRLLTTRAPVLYQDVNFAEVRYTCMEMILQIFSSGFAQFAAEVSLMRSLYQEIAFS